MYLDTATETSTPPFSMMKSVDVAPAAGASFTSLTFQLVNETRVD